MTVWPDHEFHARRITEPYVAERVNPSSLDLTLAPEYIDRGWSTWHNLMPKRLAMALSHERRRLIPDAGLLLWPGTPILASTAERISIPPECCGVLLLKSTMARKGLDHALAAYFDAGFEGDGTLELQALYPTLLTRRMRIVQLVVFNLTSPPLRTYGETGRYQGQVGPTSAREWTC